MIWMKTVNRYILLSTSEFFVTNLSVKNYYLPFMPEIIKTQKSEIFLQITWFMSKESPQTSGSNAVIFLL